MVLLGLLLVEAQARAPRGPARAAASGRPPLRERPSSALLHQRDDPLVVDAARGGHDQVVRRVACVVVRGDVGHGNRRDHLGAADDRPPQRVLAEDRRGQHVMHLVRGLVLVHRDLLDHHLALGVDLRIGRPQHHVLDHVEGLLEMAVEEARVDRRGLLAGARVHLRAHRVEGLVDLQRAEPVGALEQQVLEEVREPRLSGGLVTATGPDPEAEGDGADGGNVLRDDADSRVELRYLVGGGHRIGARCSAARCSVRTRSPSTDDRLRAPALQRRSRRCPPSRLAPAVAPSAAALRRRGGPCRPCRRSPAPRRSCPAMSGSSARRRPTRPRSRSTSTTRTSISSPRLSTSSTRVHPLAGLDVGDVQEAVVALRQLDEGAERRGLDDLAGELVADLDLLGHRADPLDQGVALLAAYGEHADDAVVVDVDLGLELLGQRADRLAALADHHADLLGVDLDLADARRVARQLARAGAGAPRPSCRGCGCAPPWPA